MMSDAAPHLEQRRSPRKISPIGLLARSAAISQANRARAEKATKPWSAVELKTAMDTYPDYVRMQELLPHRTLSALKKFCAKFDLVTRRHTWTTKDVDRLKSAIKRGLTGPEIFELFPGFTKDQVWGKTRHLHLTWPEKTPRVLGVPILDAIRQEAYRRNLSLGDLDALCPKVTTYWRRNTSRISWPHVTTALDFMDGVLEVRWNPEDGPDGRL